MVKVVVSSARSTSLAPGLPYTVEIAGKTVDTATVADVKVAFASKYPKVCHPVCQGPLYEYCLSSTRQDKS